MKKLFLSILIIFSVISISSAYAETFTNSGFIPGQVWYSKDKLVEGETVNIHTAVWNGEKSSLSIKVEFYDKNVILGSRDIIINSLELKDVSISWKVTAGDHIISAKITSSLATISNKKEKVILGRIETSNDKQFVSVEIKNNLGESVTETDLLKNQIGKTTAEISSFVPESISIPIGEGLSTVESFRSKTLVKVEAAKALTKDEIGKVLGVSSIESPNNEKIKSTGDSIKKPIAYIKLFFLSVLSFIFGSSLVFYIVGAFVVFIVVRWIYNKIRNR
ncbi:MAG: hypothetical protein WCW65_03145 [Candidatus Paceibacterota bacterium]